MREQFAKAAGIAFVGWFAISNAVAGQSFSCTFGEPACLDYGAVICKSSAKCVTRDAVCFDSYTCNFEGFVCKSQLDEAAEIAEENARKFNRLADEFNSLKSSYDNALGEYSTLQRAKEDILDCVRDSSTLDEARQCGP